MFTGPLDTRWRIEFRKQELLVPFTYIARDGESYTTPKGFLSDGASIPKIAWSVIGSPWVGNYVGAAVIHDYLCESGIVSRKKADEVFLEIMEECNVPLLKRKLIYWAVRVWSYF